MGIQRRRTNRCSHHIKELVTPTSAPPLATTRASSPPDKDRPNPVLSEFRMLTPCVLEAKNTVKNFAAIDIATNTKAGTMNVGRRVMFKLQPIQRILQQTYLL
jgi:hypothetical protein